MSDGYFNYNRCLIDEIAIQLEDLIFYNSYREYKYSDEVIEEFKIGLDHLKKASIYTHSIDWLVSDDHSEDTFLEILKLNLLNND